MASDEFMDSMLSASNEQKDKRLVRIAGVIEGCEDILNSPESTAFIKKCAIDTAYKHIVKIMREDEK